MSVEKSDRHVVSAEDRHEDDAGDFEIEPENQNGGHGDAHSDRAPMHGGDQRDVRAAQRDQQRIAMPYSLRPHEHWSTALVLDFDTDPLRQLPAGDYDLHVGMVLEGVAWFADRGDAASVLRMTVGAR